MIWLNNDIKVSMLDYIKQSIDDYTLAGAPSGSYQAEYEKALVFRDSAGVDLAIVEFTDIVSFGADNTIFVFQHDGGTALRGRVGTSGVVAKFAVYGNVPGASTVDEAKIIEGDVTSSSGSGDLQFNRVSWDQNNVVTISNVYMNIESLG